MGNFNKLLFKLYSCCCRNCNKHAKILQQHYFFLIFIIKRVVYLNKRKYKDNKHRKESIEVCYNIEPSVAKNQFV